MATTYEVNRSSPVQLYLKAAVIPSERIGNTLREIVTNKTFTPAENLIWNADLSLQGDTKGVSTDINQISFDISQDDVIVTFEQEQLASNGTGDDNLIGFSPTSGSDGEGLSITNRDFVKGYRIFIRGRSFNRQHEVARMDISTYNYPRTIVTIHYSPSLGKCDIYENGVLFHTEARDGTPAVDGTSKIYNIKYGVPTGSARNWGTLVYTKDNAAFTPEEVAEIVANPYGVVTEIGKANYGVGDDLSEIDYALHFDTGMTVTCPPLPKPTIGWKYELKIKHEDLYAIRGILTYAYGPVKFTNQDGIRTDIHQGGGWRTNTASLPTNTASRVIDISIEFTIATGELIFVVDGVETVTNTGSTGLLSDRPNESLSFGGGAGDAIFFAKIYIDGAPKRFYDFNRKSGAEVPELYYGLNGTLNNFPVDPHTDENELALTTSGWLPTKKVNVFTVSADGSKDFVSPSLFMQTRVNLNLDEINKGILYGNFIGAVSTNWGSQIHQIILEANPNEYFKGDANACVKIRDEGTSLFMISTNATGLISDGFVVFRGIHFSVNMDVVWSTPFNVRGGNSTVKPTVSRVYLDDCFIEQTAARWDTANAGYLFVGDELTSANRLKYYVNRCTISRFPRLSRDSAARESTVYVDCVYLPLGLTATTFDHAEITNMVYDSPNITQTMLDRAVRVDNAINVDGLDAFEDKANNDYRIKQTFADTYLTGTGYGGSDVASWAWVGDTGPTITEFNFSGVVTALAQVIGYKSKVTEPSGVVLGTGSVDGSITKTIDRAGGVSTASSIEGVYSKTIDVEGFNLAASTTFGLYSKTVLVDGEANGFYSSTSNMFKSTNFDGVVSGVATINGTFQLGDVTVFLFAGQVNAASNVSGSVTKTSLVSGATGAGTNTQGVYSKHALLSGGSNLTSTTTGDFDKTSSLVGAAIASSSITASVNKTLNVYGNTGATSFTRGIFSKHMDLFGEVLGSGFVSGLFYNADSVVQTYVPLIPGKVQVQMSLDGKSISTMTIDGKVYTSIINGII